MGLFSRKKITAPIFGTSESGKTNFICGLVYHATTKNKATIIEGKQYIRPRMESWARNRIEYEKTQLGLIHPVTLKFEPACANKHLKKDLYLKVYDLAGEDYAPPTKNELEYKRPSDYLLDNLTKADAAICLIDVVRRNKIHLKNGKWTANVVDEISKQCENLGGMLDHLEKRSDLKKPFVFAFTKQDLIFPRGKRKYSLDTLLKQYGSAELSMLGKYAHTFYTTSIGSKNSFPRVRGFGPIIKYISGHQL